MSLVIKTYEGSFWDISADYSTLFFQSGIPEFEFHRSDLNPKVRFTGDLLPYKKVSDQNFKHAQKLKQYEKVILISQGTIDRQLKSLEHPLPHFSGEAERIGCKDYKMNT